MHATTSFKVEEDNIAMVQELSHTRELSKILNYLQKMRSVIHPCQEPVYEL